MRVHFVLPPIERFSPVAGGAISTFTWQMAKRMLDAGYDTCVLSPSEGEPVYDDVPSETFAAAERDQLGTVRRALSKADRIWRKRDWMYYDVYLKRLVKACHTLPDADWWIGFNDLQIGMILKSRGLKGQMALRLSNECWTKHPNPNKVFAAYGRIFALSGYIQSWTLKEYPSLRSEQFCRLPNGADIEQFYPRDGFDLPHKNLKTLFVGRIDPNKGPDVAVSAIKHLQQRVGPVSLSIVGGRWFYGDHKPNTYEQALSESADEIGAELFGHVERKDMPELMRGHDILLMPSKSNEPMGQVQFEAMASGLAVIASNRGGIPESLEQIGVLINPDRLEDVVNALEKMVREPEWLIEQKRLSLARAQQMSWDNTFEQLCTALNQDSLCRVG